MDDDEFQDVIDEEGGELWGDSNDDATTGPQLQTPASQNPDEFPLHRWGQAGLHHGAPLHASGFLLDRRLLSLSSKITMEEPTPRAAVGTVSTGLMGTAVRVLGNLSNGCVAAKVTNHYRFFHYSSLSPRAAFEGDLASVEQLLSSGWSTRERLKLKDPQGNTGRAEKSPVVKL
jgi:hypothetical protein